MVGFVFPFYRGRNSETLGDVLKVTQILSLDLSDNKARVFFFSILPYIERDDRREGTVERRDAGF